MIFTKNIRSAGIITLFWLVGCSSIKPENESQPPGSARPTSSPAATQSVEKQSSAKKHNLPLQNVGDHVVDDLLSRDYMMYQTEEFTGLHYAEAAAGYGALDYAQATHDESRIEKLKQRYWQPPGVAKLRWAGHVDASVYGILPLELYLVKKDGRKLYEGLEMADAQWVDTRGDGLTAQSRFWIDDIWMVNVLQMQAYRATKNPVYIDRAALQTEIYLRELQQTNGLFFHGPKAPFFWGRGNGWVAAGVAELLKDLPRTHTRYEFIASRYRKMMKALLQNQAPSGMWKQLIDMPLAWDESSATAMFGYAISVGVRLGLLPEPSYQQAADKAWQGLQKIIDNRGRLGQVCVGTGQSADVNYYLERPRERGDLHGQAPLLWFATQRILRNQ